MINVSGMHNSTELSFMRDYSEDEKLLREPVDMNKLKAKTEKITVRRD